MTTVRTHGGAVGVKAALILEKPTFFSYLTDPGSEVGWGRGRGLGRDLSLPFLFSPLAHSLRAQATPTAILGGFTGSLEPAHARTHVHTCTSAVGPQAMMGSPPPCGDAGPCEAPPVAPPVAPNRPTPLRDRLFTPKRLFCLSYSYDFLCVLLSTGTLPFSRSLHR